MCLDLSARSGKPPCGGYLRLGSREPPAEQAIPAIAERIVWTVVRSGDEAVHRPTQVNDYRSHACPPIAPVCQLRPATAAAIIVLGLNPQRVAGVQATAHAVEPPGTPEITNSATPPCRVEAGVAIGNPATTAR
jgi:hypothetical protein